MDKEQQPRSRKATSGGKRIRPPEQNRGSAEYSGDKSFPEGRSAQGGKQASKQRQRRARQERTIQQRRHKEKQQLRRQKQQEKIERAHKRKSEAQRRPVRPVDRRRFIISLAATMAVVAAIIVFVVIFFKVKVVHVSGNTKYSVQEILEASGIEMGENLLTLSKSGVAGHIHAALPYVDEIQIGIKFPNTVNIDIVEQSAMFAIQDEAGTWWKMSEAGIVLESSDDSLADNLILVKGITARAPVVGDSFNIVSAETDSSQGTGTAEERKIAALEIMGEISAVDRSGDITLIDVKNLQDIQIHYGNSYQVLLNDCSRLAYKVRCMVQAVEDLYIDGFRGGVLDLSFREKEQAIFTPW